MQCLKRSSTYKPLLHTVWVLVISVGLLTTNTLSARGKDDVFSPYAGLLDAHLIETITTEGGLVSAFDYSAALASDDVHTLITQQKQNLAGLDPDTITKKHEAIAFWVNAYNFFMLSYILENPKVDDELIQGVKDYGSLLNPFRVFTQKVFNVGGKIYSLDDIEKGILLGREFRDRGWKDARIHFAVNCASVGCPPLRKAIYQSDTVNKMLTENVQMAFRTPRHLHIRNNTLYLSSLFDWYKTDFSEAAGSVSGFIRQYAGDDLNKTELSGLEIRYIDYNWSLNEPGNFPDIE